MKRSKTNRFNGKRVALHNRLLSIGLMLAVAITSSACNKDDSGPATSDPTVGTEAEDANAANAADETDQSQAERTVVRTDNPDDVKLATDVLMAFVTSELVDARRFSVTVSDGVAHITPSEGATDDEQREAAALAQNVEGIQSVNIGGAAAPHIAAENSEAVAEAVAAEGSPSTDDGPSAAEEQPEAEAVAEPDEEAAGEDTREQEQVDDEDEAETAPPAPAGNFRSYTIKRGDTLSIIAARELGSGGRWNQIYELNRDVIGSNPDGIRDGMVIRLPVE